MGWIEVEGVVDWPRQHVELSAVDSDRMASIPTDPVVWGWRGVWRGRLATSGYRFECRQFDLNGLDFSRPRCLRFGDGGEWRMACVWCGRLATLCYRVDSRRIELNSLDSSR